MASSEPRLLAPLAAALLALSSCATSSAASAAGTPAMNGLPLVPTSGAPATVGELLSRADATVFVFWSAGCPCVRRYQGRVDALAAEWAPKGVAFVEVSSNAGETLASLQVAARERALARPVWRDEGGHLAKELGARSTPTMVLLRRDGRVLYRGWLDNERLPGEAGREAWLEAALTGFRTGTSFATKSPTWGCTITRSLSAPEAPACHAPSSEVATSNPTSPGGTP
jgi:hypothetical protein